MKSAIILLVLYAAYCYGQLLGGWSTSEDDFLKRDCLKKGLVHIHGGNMNREMLSQVSEHHCKTQVVNGLNIKCTFILRGQKWHCSYYKSFIHTLEPQVEQCKKIEDEQIVPVQTKDEEVVPAQNEDEEVVPKQKEDEHDDEELKTANEGDKAEQPLISDNDDQEEQPASVNENEKEEQGASADKDEREEQVAQESLITNDDEEDDEAKIDAMNKQISKQNANNQEEQQQ